MNILGINAYHGDSSVCIMVDGKLIAATEEERFRRVKHWAGFPSEAINLDGSVGPPRGYYPTWILRLFRNGKARCEERGVNERLIVEGSVGYLKNDSMHEDRKGLSEWITKHNHYATSEAEELLKRAQGGTQHEIQGGY